MHRADKTPEPSMEEILASIRKIIAEEPIGSRAGPESQDADADGEPPLPAGDPGHRADGPTLSIPSRSEDDSEGPPYSVEDALADLMDDPQRRSGRAAGKDEFSKPQSRPGSDEDSRPSWLFGRQSSPPGGAPQSPAGASTGADRGQGGGLLGQLGSLRESPERAAAEGGISGTRPTSGPKPLEIGSIFDRHREAGRPAPADFPTLPQVPSHDVPRPAAPRVPAREGSPASARADEGSAPVPPAASPAAPRSAAPMPMARSPEPAADRAPGHKPEERLRPAPSEPAARQDKAAPLVDTNHGQQRERPTEAVRTAVQSVGAASGNEKPVASPAPQPSTEPPLARTLEDTVADLLRPMLREWLDANMPRIVEKALRVELAASAKRPGTDGSG